MMKHRLIPFLLVFLAAAPAYSSDQDPLWQKTLDLFSQNTRWHPRTMLVITKEYDEAGKLKSTTSTSIEYHIDTSGELKSEIILAVKDGKDITEKQKRGRRREGNQFMISPFNPEYQESVEVTPTRKMKRIGSGSCRGYELAMEYEKNRYSGTAWIDTETGAPLLLTLKMETLPRFLDFMNMNFYYSYSDSGNWYAAKIEMEGEGTILFQKKRFYSETTLQDYFIYAPGENTRERGR